MDSEFSGLQELVCERVMIHIRRDISLRELGSLRSSMEVSAHVDDVARSLVVQVTASVPAVFKERLTVHERWPADWWQAFKERWFPEWLKRRYPVQWESLDIDKPIYAAVCPHIESDPQERHLRWLFYKQEGVINANP